MTSVARRTGEAKYPSAAYVVMRDMTLHRLAAAAVLGVAVLGTSAPARAVEVPPAPAPATNSDGGSTTPFGNVLKSVTGTDGTWNSTFSFINSLAGSPLLNSLMSSTPSN
jgi:hypothetical protein